MNPIEHYLDMAAHCVTYARQTTDKRYRSFLIDLATTWCDLAGELLDGAANGLERLGETTKVVAELNSFDAQASPSLEGLEPHMIPGLEPRIIH
jgi:hypothetical protein